MTLAVPDRAVPYVLFQRTGYLVGTRIPIVNRLLRRLPYNRYVAMEAKLFCSRIKRQYSSDMADEYARIRQHLPKAARSIVDIGCGVAGIDVFLQRHYSAMDPEFFLIDRSETSEKVYYDFHGSAAFYNSLMVAMELLEANGVARERIHVQEALEGRIMFPRTSYDLMVSLISWGFHYPVSTYLEEVKAKLATDGVLILDVRHGSGGEELIRGAFRDVSVIFAAPKFNRLMAHR